MNAERERFKKIFCNIIQEHGDCLDMKALISQLCSYEIITGAQYNILIAVQHPQDQQMQLMQQLAMKDVQNMMKGLEKVFSALNWEGPLQTLHQGLVETSGTEQSIAIVQSESVFSTKGAKLIIVDPGFGGSQPGAVAGVIKGKDLNLKTSLKLKSHLQHRGYRVQLTRSTDIFLSIADRAQMANSWGADLFVSVHFNSAESAAATGVEAWHFKTSTKGQKLATIIAAEVAGLTGAKNRGAKSSEGFVVLKKTKMTAVLVEPGFISNPDELQKFLDDSYLDKIVEGIANGVHKFLDIE